MMKKYIRLTGCAAVLTAACLLMPYLSAQNVPKMTPLYVSDANRAYDPGESITMTIQYRCIGIRSDVGHATFRVSEDRMLDSRRTFTVNAKGMTVPFFDKFFKVRDNYSVRFFADNTRPLTFHRSVYEGGYSLTNDFLWDTDSDDIHAYCQYLSSGRIKDTLIAADSSTYDVLSIVYAARNIDYSMLATGTVFPFTFVIDEETYDIYFRYEGRERKKIPQMGEFNALKIAVKVVEGEVFSGDYEIFMYVTDDRNHIPLWIESPIIVGSVLARLTGYENIKHPLTSRLSD